MSIAVSPVSWGGDVAPDPFDRAEAERWVGIVRQTIYRYFHPAVIGAENLPATGPGLVIGCHSGALPWDAACLLVAIHDSTGRFARFMGDSMFGRYAPVARFLERQGAHVGRPDVVERLLLAGNLVQLYPGGALDLMRPYLSERYQVLPHRGFAPGRGGYIKIALRTRAPIIPMAIVGPEEAHVYLGNIAPVARATGLPYFPLVVFPFPLPTKFFIRFGTPIRLRAHPEDARDQQVVDRLNKKVRGRVQALIDDTRAHRHGLIFGSYR